MVRALFLLLLLGGSVDRHHENRHSTFCSALYAEDAGVLDFTVETAGHGAVGWAYPFHDTVITTDVLNQGGMKKSSTSCFVASRHQSDGSLVWRRNVCSEYGENQAHSLAVLSGGEVFFTLDHVGVVRAWALDDASLLWDAKVDPSPSPKLWVISGSKELLAVASQEELVFLNAETGEAFDTVNALKSMNGHLRKGQTIHWLALANIAGKNSLKGVFAYVNADGIIQSGNDVYYVELEVGNDQFKSVRSWNKGKHIVADTVVLQPTADGNWHAFAIMKSGAAVVDVTLDSSSAAEEIAASKFHPKWTSVVAVEATAQPSVVRMIGKASPIAESTMALFRLDNAVGWERLYGLEDPPDIEYTSMMYCPVAELVLSTGSDTLIVYRHDSVNPGSATGTTHERLSPLTPLTISGDVFVPDGDTITSASIISCSKDKVTAVLSTERGSTTLLSLDVVESNIVMNVDWAAEEGLSKVSSVVFVDASHLGFDELVEEQDVVTSKLSLAVRLASQWENTLKLMSADGLFETVSHSNRDHIFGFVKIAALLSPSVHRLWGMNTAGTARGRVRWSLDLPKEAMWHSMVHGTTNSAKAIHGINGDTHSREILVLSATPSSVDWMCVDGTSGAVNAHDSVSVSSQVLQVLPIYGPSSGGCRQSAFLLHENRSVTVIPTEEETIAFAEKQLHKSPNGLYTHYIDKVSNQIQSFQISFAEKNPSLLLDLSDRHLLPENKLHRWHILFDTRRFNR
jgi:hypothetical protein